MGANRKYTHTCKECGETSPLFDYVSEVELWIKYHEKITWNIVLSPLPKVRIKKPTENQNKGSMFRP